MSALKSRSLAHCGRGVWLSTSNLIARQSGVPVVESWRQAGRGSGTFWFKFCFSAIKIVIIEGLSLCVGFDRLRMRSRCYKILCIPTLLPATLLSTASSWVQVVACSADMAGLVKAKKYDWKDSNLALFGSDTERQVPPCAIAVRRRTPRQYKYISFP